jgi:uncharacterized delta-60 repeat protein
VISFTSLALIAQTPAAAADGDLDTSWDTDGMKVTDLHASGEDYITDVLVQPDGNILLSGSWNNNGQTGRYSWYQQLKDPDGSNASGYTSGTLFWSPRTDQISQTLLDADGKEVSVGWAGTDTNDGAGNYSNHNYDYDCAVIRKDNGVLDSSFSGNGKMLVTFSSSRNDYCTSLVIQSDGKIVVGGYVKNSSNLNQWTLARINTDGTLDTTFGGNSTGKMELSLCDITSACGSMTGSSQLEEMALQSDGKIIAAGSQNEPDSSSNYAVVRLTTTGALDTSFSSDGIHAFDLGASNRDKLKAMALQSNGKIVVGGFNDTKDWGLARLNTDGSMDTSFGGGDGITITDFGGDGDKAFDLVIESDGKIVMVGESNAGSSLDFAIARYTTAGALDTSFSGDGKVLVDIEKTNGGGGDGYDDAALGAAIAANGNIIVGGYTSGGGDADWATAMIVSSSTTPAITMAAFGKFKKDDANSTIATHEDPNVTEVPGGYQSGDTMNSNHEFDGDYDVNGSDRTFTLVLGAQPPTNVVFDFTIGAWVGADDHVAANTTLGTDLIIKDSGNNTVTQATFTNGNWSTAQTFTVVPVQDNVIEGFENGAIIATVNDAASDDMYGIMSVQKNIVIWDDDHSVTAGWDHVNGAVDGLNLKAFPSEVVMTDYMEKGEQYLVDPNNGTAVRWYCIDPTSLANHGGDIGNYIRSLGQDGVWASQVWVGTQIDHDGNTTFWRSQFANKNWVSLDNMDFTTADSAVQRYVWGSDGKLRWSDDSEVPNGETGTACSGDDRLYMGSAAKKEEDTPAVPAGQVTVRAVTANDPEHTQGTQTVVEGSSITFDVKLGAPPVNSEAVSFTSPYAGASFSPSSITFTNDNYATRQTVTLSVANNDLEEGTSTNSTVVWAAYGTTGTFAYIITDNDTAAITLSKTTTSVSEAATTDTFTVVLTTDPATDVDISVISADTGEATVSTGELAFTTDNWNTPQTVTVTGVNDGSVDGDISHAITLAVIDAQSDATYDPVSDVVVTNTTADNDSAGFTVTQSGGSTAVAESGSTDTFTVVLTAQPASDVVLSVVSGDTGEATVDKSTLTFTNGNWNSAQTVTVTGVNDDLDDGNVSATITLAVVDASSADAFDNVANQTVSAVNADNDTAGFTIAHTGGATVVTEDAGTDTFSLVLNAEPAGNVVLSVSSADTGEVTTGASTVTFTAGNWNSTQNVTLTGVNDDVDDGNVDTTMTIAVVDGSSSNEFDNVANQTFTVANTDNDEAAFTVSPSATTVTEGATITVTVVLETSPNTNVMIDISSGDTSELTISSVTVTFTAGNWSVNQTITLTAVDDTDQDGTQNVTLTTAVNDAASDPAYDPLANQTVEFSVADNDAVAEVDPDFDSDGIYNWAEEPGCALLPDCDFDGILDPDELNGCVTDPDCDDDLISDGSEIYACQLTPDCDGDGVNDVDERTSACIQDPSCRLVDLDRDGDGILDKDELTQCVLNPDCDGDGIGDKGELMACVITPDCDMDGVGDALEQAACIQDPLCGPALIDTDGDGLTDSFEYSIAERCVTDTDCDDDGVADGFEVLACMLLADCDADGAGDKYEANKACVQDPECVPLGMSTEEHEVGLMTDFGELLR